jgi:hypothetical protein
MKRTAIAVTLISMTASLICCTKRSDQPVTAASQPRPSGATQTQASQTTPQSAPAPSAQSEADKTCQALEARTKELDPSYPGYERERKIQKRGYTDKEYTEFKDCSRRLENEKPFLSFDNQMIDWIYIKFGMTREDVVKRIPAGRVLEDCKPFPPNHTKVVSECRYQLDLSPEIANVSGPPDVATVFFDSNGRLIEWNFSVFLPKNSPRLEEKDTSAVIRYWRDEVVRNLGVPDEQDDHSSYWRFGSRSQKDEFGNPKALESVALAVRPEGKFFFLTITYTDDENYRDQNN